MNKKNVLISAALGMLFAGCMPPGEIDDAEEFGTTSDALDLGPAFGNLRVEDAFVALVSRGGDIDFEDFGCRPDEVMVGIHLAGQKLICAQLNDGYRVRSTYYDDTQQDYRPWGPYTKVSTNPIMHGCSPNYFMRRTRRYSSGREIHKCVSLETSSGEALNYSSTLHDGRGSTVIASVPTYGLYPNMHVCPAGFAMAGFHASANDLYCAE